MPEITEQTCPSWVADFDVMTDPDHHEDPYPHYKELRSTCPVAHSDRHGGYWIVTRSADIATAFRETDVFSTQQVRVDDVHSGMLPPQALREDGLDLGVPVSLTTMDPVTHGLYREVLTPLFSFRRVQSWEPGMRAAATSLLEGIKDHGSCEFAREFATEYTILVFLDILGVPQEDRGILRDIHRQLELVHQGLLGPEDAKSYQIDELVYYARLVEGDDGTPKDTLVSFLNNAEVDGRALTLQQKMRLCQQFARAGLHTTASSLSNMLFYLSSRLDQRDRLVQHPELTRNAVEELLRYESIASPSRLVVADTELGGQQLHPGDKVFLALGSAGRDEMVFEHPEEVDFERSPIPHMAFSVGRHRCIGMHLARAELRVALEEMHRMLPNYRRMPGRTPVRHTGAVRTTNELWLDV